MRTDTIATLAGILSGIKINKISDKEVKAGLLKDYLALRKVSKVAEEERNEIVSKFHEDWGGETPTKEAEKDAEDAIRVIYGRDMDLALEKVKSEPLYDPDIWADDITLGQIPGTIDFLVANGVAE